MLSAIESSFLINMVEPHAGDGARRPPAAL
jgi:hypothetical protein